MEDSGPAALIERRIDRGFVPCRVFARRSMLIVLPAVPCDMPGPE
jgi:hypothetical protein